MTLLLLLACATPEPAPAPVAPVAEELPLYELLYAGEAGEPAAQLGDRLRALVWLQELELSTEQLGQLKVSALKLQTHMAELQAARSALDAQELATLQPLYQRLAVELTRAPPDERALAALVSALRHAQAAQVDDTSLEAARAALNEAIVAMGLLEDEQRAAMRHALFLLRRPLGPDQAAWLMGSGWSDGDFASLRRLERGPEEPTSRDIAGLWVREDGDPTEAIEGVRLQVLLALALAEPAVVEAIEVLQGTRPAELLVPGAPEESPESEPDPG